jgi:carbamoyl-phosphate synthase large subunit
VTTLARRCESVRRVVFASSYDVYDPALYCLQTPKQTAASLTEDDPVHPAGLSGMAKLAHEMELRALAQNAQRQFSILSVRMFPDYGPGGHDMISAWSRNLLSAKSITVTRADDRLDYIHAADSAEGLLRLAMCEHATGVVNLGVGRARRVREVIGLLRQYFPAAANENAPAGAPIQAGQASTVRLEKLIGWKPTRTLETDIPAMIEFESQARATWRRGRDVGFTQDPLLRALRQAALRLDPHAQLVAGDLDPMAAARFEADDFWLMPRLSDDQLTHIFEGCRARSISGILPTEDDEFAFWAGH